MNIRDLTFPFTPVPITFPYLMDSDCLKAMTLLIQEESYWDSKGKLSNGYFYKSVKEIKDALFMKNEKDARLTIEALYRSNLIHVIATDGKRSTLRIKLNWNRIEELAGLSLREIQTFESPIVKLRRDETLTYCQHIVEDVNEKDDNLSTKCTPTINNLDNIDIIEKEKEKKESLSSSLSSFSSSFSSEEQEQESFNPDDSQEYSTQETEDEEDEKWFDEVTEYIRTNAFRELRGETITKEDENFQKSIRMLMEYDNFSRKEAIEVYNEILHRFKDTFRKLPSLWRKTEQSSAD